MMTVGTLIEFQNYILLIVEITSGGDVIGFDKGVFYWVHAGRGADIQKYLSHSFPLFYQDILFEPS